MSVALDGSVNVKVFLASPSDEEKATDTASTPTGIRPSPARVPNSNSRRGSPHVRAPSTPRVRQEPPPAKNVCGMSKTKFLDKTRPLRGVLKKIMRRYFANHRLRVARNMIRMYFLRHLLKIAFLKRRDAAATAALVMTEVDDPQLSPVRPEAAAATGEDGFNFKAIEDDCISNEMQVDYNKLRLHECDAKRRIADSKVLHDRFMKTINARKNRHLPIVPAIGAFASSPTSDDETANAASASSSVANSDTKPRKKKKK